MTEVNLTFNMQLRNVQNFSLHLLQNEFQNLRQASSDKIKVLPKDRRKEGGSADAGIMMAISLGSLTTFCFMLAIVISLVFLALYSFLFSVNIKC